MNKLTFRTWMDSGELVLLDGATGTQLALMGMPQGVCPEQWILDHPQSILDVQRAYRQAGSHIVYTPTFGGNRIKLGEFGLADQLVEINRRLAQLSREASGDGIVLGDLAPTGQFTEPFGPVPFEETVAIYREQALALLEGGVDGFVIETMMDVQEARAALLAVRDVSDLPVLVSMTFDAQGRTLTGTDPRSALITLQALGADAFGCNCSCGPAQMLDVIRQLKPWATVPLLAKPNAGMPRLVDGKTVFDMQPEEFSAFIPAFIEAGVNLFGGCCGTGPDYIAGVARHSRGLRTRPPVRPAISAVSSIRGNCRIGIDQPFSLIGERINPTGKKAMQAELREGSLNLVKKFAQEQEENGAAVLDINMGLSGLDEMEMMRKAVALLAQSSPLPLCIDSTRPEVIEAALRLYPGRALVNSISGEKERIEKTLPIVARYGAMFVVLPITDQGIPEALDDRKQVVRNILEHAERQGCHREDVVVDGLVMTVSSNPEAARVTLDLIEWCTRELGVNTVCGVSNVSFGLPERAWVNAAFLMMAVSRGMSMAIANPSSEMVRPLLLASDALNGRDRRLQAYVRHFGGNQEARQKTPTTEALLEKTWDLQVADAVVEGDADGIPVLIRGALQAGFAPRSLVDNCLIPAIEKVGVLFEKKEYFLPQLIMSADAMRVGFSVLEPLLMEQKTSVQSAGSVVLATVKGDIHDIGKNIVALMLRNYGYEVIDLGKDVDAESIVQAASAHQADVIGLSALMTTTMVNMKEVVCLARARGLSGTKIMVGGAVVDQLYADEIGADGYAPDAMGAVRLVNAWLKKNA